MIDTPAPVVTPRECDAELELARAAPVLAQQLAGSGMLDDGVFRTLLRPAMLRAFVERDLERFAAGLPFATKNAPPGHLRLYTADDLSVRALVVRADTRPSRTILTVTRNTFVGNAGRAPFHLRRYQLPPDSQNEIFDPGRRLTAADDVRLDPGSAVALRAGFEAYDVLPEERTAIAMTAAGPPLVPLAWRYDRATLRPLRAEPARTSWARLQELLAFAGMIGDASLLPALEAALAHPSHFVRWSAAKTAFAVAPEGGRKLLATLADDPHPQLRAAARALLARTETQ